MLIGSGPTRPARRGVPQAMDVPQAIEVPQAMDVPQAIEVPQAVEWLNLRLIWVLFYLFLYSNAKSALRSHLWRGSSHPDGTAAAAAQKSLDYRVKSLYF